MSKARITVTFEYELKPEWYPECATPERMVQIDVANYQDNRALFDVIQSHEVTVTGEVVED